MSDVVESPFARWGINQNRAMGLMPEGYWTPWHVVDGVEREMRAEITRLRAELASAVAAERERCARVAEGMQCHDYDDDDAEYNYICAGVAAAIRGADI